MRVRGQNTRANGVCGASRSWRPKRYAPNSKAIQPNAWSVSSSSRSTASPSTGPGRPDQYCSLGHAVADDAQFVAVQLDVASAPIASTHWPSYS